jgi:predicted negative regulator of RcsB-dependent stress response
MTDDDPIADLAARALRAWEDGALEESVALYQEALVLTRADHWARAMYLGELAGVLAQLGRKEEALEQYELALACELALENGDDSNAVATARYFLAEYLLLLGRASRALETIAPSLGKVVAFEGLLRMLEAEALRALGRNAEARTAATLARAAATSSEQREKIQARVGGLLPEALPS